MIVECWIFHTGGEGKLSQTVQKAVENYWEINGQNASEERGRQNRVKHVDIWRNAQKAKIQLFKLQPERSETEVSTHHS